jgi:hypothetical protein
MMRFLKQVFFLLTLQIVALASGTIYAQSSGQEAAYLQTDRTTYVAGEPVYYKFYLLDAGTGKLSNTSKVGYILIRAANQHPVLKIKVDIAAGTSNGRIVLPDSLISGVYQLVAFTGMMKNQGASLFDKEIVIVNRFDKELNFKLTTPVPSDTFKALQTDSTFIITTDKTEYGPREKVKVSLGKLNSKATLAVSVSEETNTIPDKTIVKALTKSSDAAIKIQPKDINLPESSGKILRGTVQDELTGKDIPNAVVLLSRVDSVPDLQYANTNRNGVFQLLLDDYYNGKELFLTIKDVPAGQHWKIRLADDFALSYKWNPSTVLNNSISKAQLAKSQQIVYINKTYQLNNDVKEEPTPEKSSVCPRFYYNPVKTTLLSDFVPLNDFPEIVVELFPTIQVNKYKDNYSVLLMNATRYRYTEPVIFLDGVYVDDANKIMGFGSEKIKKIDVLAAERIFGDLVFNGVIAITSKSNEILKTTPAPQSLRIKNEKRQGGKSFVTVHPDSLRSTTTPFFKQLLYWNPGLELNETGTTGFEFYTSDNTADFVIRAEGISENGTPVSVSKRIKVTNQPND